VEIRTPDTIVVVGVDRLDTGAPEPRPEVGRCSGPRAKREFFTWYESVMGEFPIK
jgi:hypothetical protein